MPPQLVRLHQPFSFETEYPKSAYLVFLPDYVLDAGVQKVAQELVEGVVGEAYTHDRTRPVMQQALVRQQEPNNFRPDEGLHVRKKAPVSKEVTSIYVFFFFE